MNLMLPAEQGKQSCWSEDFVPKIQWCPSSLSGYPLHTHMATQMCTLSQANKVIPFHSRPLWPPWWSGCWLEKDEGAGGTDGRCLPWFLTKASDWGEMIKGWRQKERIKCTQKLTVLEKLYLILITEVQWPCWPTLGLYRMCLQGETAGLWGPYVHRVLADDERQKWKGCDEKKEEESERVWGTRPSSCEPFCVHILMPARLLLYQSVNNSVKWNGRCCREYNRGPTEVASRHSSRLPLTLKRKPCRFPFKTPRLCPVWATARGICLFIS